jgi:hypothetical protein
MIFSPQYRVNLSGICDYSIKFSTFHLSLIDSHGSAVGIATGYRLDQGVGVRVLVGPRIFTLPYHPDWLWGSPSLLSNGYSGLFPRHKAAAA